VYVPLTVFSLKKNKENTVLTSTNVVFFSLLIWWATLINFQKLNQTCIAEMNPTCVVMYNYFYIIGLVY
jgi:hypothetical protein